ncbi:MAG: hypothetical protein IJR13_06050 [Bacteroidales bacterium]|nr:hypothetical protein [Bacteroidales bacterium]
MKKNIIHLSILLAALFTFAVANAQMLERNDIIYNSTILPQSNHLNPAFFQPNRDIFISLPGVGVSVGLPVSYGDFRFVPDNQKEGKYLLDIYSLARNLQNDKSIHVGSDIDILGFGFHIKRFFFTLNLSASVNSSLYFPSGLSNIITGGLIRCIGRENAAGVVFDDFVNVSAYERVAIGLGYDITDNLTIGAHVNILNGVASGRIDDVNALVWSENDAYSEIRGNLQYRFLRAGALSYDFDDNEFTFVNSFNNMGFTFDLGAVYRWNKFTFSASLLDIGTGIHWKDNAKEINPKYNDLKFNGNDLGDFITSGVMDMDFFNNVTDTLTSVVDYVEKDVEGYWQSIPSKMYVGVGYNVTNWFRANLLFHGEWDNGIMQKDDDGLKFFGDGSRFRYNASLSASVKAGNMLELMVANAFCFDGERGSIINPGVGVTLAPGNALQLYLMADYISSFKAVDIKGTRLQFGLNICFGHDRTKTISMDDDTVL